MKKTQTTSPSTHRERRRYLAAGAAMLVLGIAMTDIPTMVLSMRWPATTGTISTRRLVGTAVREWSGDGDMFIERDVFISYEYTVDGQPYESSTVNAISSPFSLYPPHYARKYPTGKVVPVYYSPANPSRAVLEPGFVEVHRAFDVISLLVLSIGLYWVVRGISGSRAARNRAA